MVREIGTWAAVWHAVAGATLLTALGAQQVAGGAATPYTIELAPKQLRAVVGQQLAGELQVGFDVDWQQQHGLALVAQPLDLPFAVQSDWFGDEANWQVAFVDAEGGPRAVVGERVVRWRALGEQVRDGRRWRTFAADFVATPRAPGAVVPAVAVRYAYTSGFHDDFLRGRQPLDRHDASVSAAASAWTIAALPDQAEPAGFGGAVGEFTLQVELRTAASEVGRELDVDLVVRGRGDLSAFAAPPLPNLPGWFVVGVREKPRNGARVFGYQVVALRDGERPLGPFELVVFDPRQWAYTTLRTEPVTVTVAPATNLAALPAPVRQKVEADAQERAAANAVPAWYWLVVIVAGGCTLLGAVRTRQRAARRRRAQSAREALLLVLDGDPARLLQCFEVLVAACRGSGPLGEADWAQCDDVTRDLRQRLADAAYGGPRPDGAELRAFAQRLVADLR